MISEHELTIKHEGPKYYGGMGTCKEGIFLGGIKVAVKQLLIKEGSDSAVLIMVSHPFYGSPCPSHLKQVLHPLFSESSES